MKSDFTPFDLKRMFLGDTPPLFLAEIAVRVVIIYIFAVLVMQFFGKRGAKQMTPLEYVVIIALGSAAGDPMFYPEIPIVFAFIVITTVVAVNTLLAKFKKESTLLKRAMESEPVIIVKDGKFLNEILEREKFTKEMLFSQLRENGVRYLEEVDVAVLEESGKLSIFRKDTTNKKTDLVKKL